LGFVCLIEVHLHFPDNGSLKGKRRELSSLKAQLQRRFGASVAETGHHDLWQRATLTVAIVGHDASSVRERADGVRRFVDFMFPEQAVMETLVVSAQDLLER
jgi:uncharacterized protein YlxP (DUF503 family)